MKHVQAPDRIETWRIVCAAQSRPDYSEDRQILLYGAERGDYYGNGPFILLDGGHCSCYDWEDVEWDAVEYTYDELITLADSKLNGDGCYEESEKRFWQMVKIAVCDEF